MANSHVPKFGDWDEDNIPYTAFFDNARKAGKKMNPNDPQENPEAFMAMNRKMTPETTDADSHAQPLPPRPVAAAQKPQEDQPRSRSHRRNRSGSASIGTASRSHRSITSESGSEKTSSDYSLPQHRNHQRASSDRNKSHGSDDSVSRSEHEHRRERSSSNNSTDHVEQEHRRIASIPKFGGWDVNDPRSGEGYTYIFEKAREDKQSVNEVPIMPPPPSHYYKDQGKCGRSSSKSKTCCCLFPNVRD
ncbi:hypothetical protein UlMin_016472 [Ulmus minor]